MAYITKADIQDDIVDDFELLSDASSTYNYTSVSAISTNGDTKVVTVGLTSSGEGILTGRDARIEHPDIAIISGTSGGLGDGTFTVNEVLSDSEFTVVESIGASTGGTVQFRKPSGAKKVGVDTAGFVHSTNNVLQTVLADLDAAITGGAGDLGKAVFKVDGGICYTTVGDVVIKRVL